MYYLFIALPIPIILFFQSIKYEYEIPFMTLSTIVAITAHLLVTKDGVAKRYSKSLVKAIGQVLVDNGKDVPSLSDIGFRALLSDGF